MSRLNLYRRLRSRRLAVWLIAGIAAYAGLMASVPQGALTAAKVVQWRGAHPMLASVTGALGLHRAFSQPWFLVAALLLIASLIACSWERSVLAIRDWRTLGRPLSEDDSRWNAHARELPDDLGESDALATVARALEDSGLRTRSEDGQLVAWRNRWGVIGSPVFHWVLAALFVAVIAGQATKSEGVMAVVHGSAKPEVAESYGGGLYTGPLYVGHRRTLTIAVPDAKDPLVVGGIDRGYSPRVVLTDAGKMVRDAQVYPNNPLRYGSLTVHEDGFGPSLRVTLSSPNTTPQTSDLTFVRNDSVRYGIEPYTGGYTGDDGVAYVLRIEPRPGKRMAVMVRAQDAATWSFQREIGLGDTAALPGDVTFDPVSFGSYSLLLVSNDPFMETVVVLLLVTSVVVALPLFASPRAVWARVSDGRLQTVIRTRRIDPVFGAAVRGRIERAVGADTHAGEDA